MSVLSNSIGNLKHLRYFDLSGAKITRVPESICSLHNLEILILRWCQKLVELPANIVSLISLRHLDITFTRLRQMPPQMGKLTKLRMLSDFYVGKQSGCGIKEVGELQHLRGTLFIRNLQHVMDAQDALKANLKGEEHLETLDLSWGNSDNSQVQEEVLEQLQPHKNTKWLTIDGYGGTRFPDWIGDSSLPLLQRLHIRSCPNLKKSLFTHFPSLTELHIEECEQLEIECNPLESFPKLESLAIRNCLNLSFSIGASPASNLKSLPQHLHSVVPSLTTLFISRCPELESFPEGGLPSQLQNLWIDGCNKLIANRMEWDLQSLPSLSHLRIGSCEDVVSFPEETLLPSTLTYLEISDLENLKSLEYRGLHHLTSLRELQIRRCPNLQSMPVEALPLSLPYLRINECPLLGKKCEKEIGEYWPKISHIPRIEIDYKKIN